MSLFRELVQLCRNPLRTNAWKCQSSGRQKRFLLDHFNIDGRHSTTILVLSALTIIGQNPGRYNQNVLYSKK